MICKNDKILSSTVGPNSVGNAADGRMALLHAFDTAGRLSFVVGTTGVFTCVHRNVDCCAHAAHSQPTQAPSSSNTAPVQSKAVLDRLIAVFAAKSPTEWRKLIAHSKQWPQLAAGVLARCFGQTRLLLAAALCCP